jgi:alkylated DNA repair dioxygenase AlkB
MDAYLLRKRRRSESPGAPDIATRGGRIGSTGDGDHGEETTDVKLGILASLFPHLEQEALLDVLIASDGSIEAASSALLSDQKSGSWRKKRAASHVLGVQSSLTSFGISTPQSPTSRPGSNPLVTKRGKTLHLYSPEDVAKHSPCTIIHHFLLSDEATALLKELLAESESFHRQKFQLFDTVVESPHSSGFYVSSAEEQRQQRDEYSYNGIYRTDVRQLTPELRRVSSKVRDAVNAEIQKRISSHYPDGKKLQFQSPREWIPNAAFVNCYDGPGENVGWHSDELTYLGPRAVIGSLSLGVEREFRVRRIVPPDDDDNSSSSPHSRADMQGQISIHLPHNSLLVMHAETQEEWKHSIAPAQAITPHPVAGNKRINVTYRWYRESLHPRHTPRCQCGMPCVLRCVQRNRVSRGKYMWMCYAGYAPGKKSCGYFQWAQFDDDGEPIWATKESKTGESLG